MIRPNKLPNAQERAEGRAYMKDKFSGMKAKVIDKVSDVLSYPARRKAQKSMIKSGNIINDMKLVNEAKGTQDKGDYTDPLFRARANVSGYKVDSQMKALKNSR